MGRVLFCFVGFNTSAPGQAINIAKGINHTIQQCTFDYCIGSIRLSESYYRVLNNHFNHVGTCVYAVHSRKYGADLPTISGSTVNGANDGFLLMFNDNSNPQIINNTDSNYWVQKANTSAGNLAQLEADAMEWEQEQVSLETQIASVWADIQQLSANSSLSPAQLGLLMQQYQDLDSLKAIEKASQLALVEHFRTVSAALPASHIFEANQKKANVILCDLYARETFECTPSELDTLRSIATQCPLEGGGAVLQARGLLELIVHEYFNTGSDCLNSQERSVEKGLSSDEIKILPNPNSGTFQIQLPSRNTPDWNIEIFDLNGRSRWQSTSSRNDVQVSSLQSGFYVLVCMDARDGRRTTQRLIIQN